MENVKKLALEVFEVEDNNDEYIMIKMKRKRDPMNCTN